MRYYIRLRLQILNPFEQNSTAQLEVVYHTVPFPLKTLHLLRQVVNLTPLARNDLLHLLLTHARRLGALAAHHLPYGVCGLLTLLKLRRLRILLLFVLARQKCCLISH